MGLQPNQTDYIHPLRVDDLKRARGKGNRGAQGTKESHSNVDACPAELMRAEMDYIHAWRKERGSSELDDGNTKLTGLALSGGGIRSATFSLGVMQALASRSLLKRVDYLSTVSGGGYIGSALSWLLSNQAYDNYRVTKSNENSNKKTESETPDIPRFGVDADNFPFGTDDPDPAVEKHAGEAQRSLLTYLRDHGYYLTPGSGINAFSLLGVVLRGAFLNVTMWMPVFVLFFVFGLWFFGMYHPEVMPVLAMIMPADALTPLGEVDYRLFGFELFLWIGLGLSLLLMGLTLLYSLLTWFRRQSGGAMLANMWYGMRRFAEHWAAMLLASILLLLLVGSLPVIGAYLKGWAPSVGPAAMLSGMGMAMRAFLKSGGDSSSVSSDILAPVAAGFFMFGGFLVAYELAYWMADKEWLHLAVWVMIASSLLFGWFVNLNYISIHRYYRDRLMETFMPDITTAMSNETGAAQGANVAKLFDFAYHDTPPCGPYHIVNTNVILADSKMRVYKKRGGDNFILSPLYCGSNATGWCRTENFADGTMTLATAVAISGAAANPNTGVGGVGLTRNRLVSFVMSLLNLGLGYWAEHPDSAKSLLVKHVPNHFHPGLYSFGSLVDWSGFNENRAFLQLSDGGHFENTGVYELVRRRMRLIIVCDGGADAAFSFSDFQTTVRRIEDDFGARIKVLDEASPDQVVPVPPAPGEEAVYPKDARFARQGHMVAHIIYADGSEGWMIFLKTTLIKELSFKVKGYAAQNKEFPDQSTADQFFDDVQFEAYRELGYRLTIKMLESPIPKGLRCEGLSSSQDQNLEAFITTCSA